MTTRLRISLLFTLFACNPKSDLTATATETDASSSSDAGTLGNTQTTSPTTTDPSTTTTSTSTSTSTTTEVTSTDAMSSGGVTTVDETSTSTGTDSSSTTSTTSTTDGTCDDPPNQPQDSECVDPSGCGCAPGHCFVIPALGGFCGECEGDDDCPGGCTVPNPIGGKGSLCNDGGPGDGCQVDATCVDPSAAICGVVLSVPGIIEVSTCGECEDNADCKNAQEPNCSPDYDIANFTGVLSCKANKSVPNDQGCDFTEDGMGVPLGNKACQSGFCGQANVMGVLKMGVCGECNADADCMPGEQCTEPAVDLDQNILIGSVCM